MSDAADPRWELLPHDPQQFFALPDGFDLGDLKRSYNRLIRRFKPEKFPAEFQRIRAAYEQLNDALRYNISLRPAPRHPRRPEPKAEPQSPEPQPPSATPEEFAPASPATDSAKPQSREPAQTPESARRATTPPACDDAPQATYSRLKYLETKSAKDYLTLALLADVVQPHIAPGQPESFLDWLFAGLADHPREWSLTSVLRQYLIDEHEVAKLPALLLRVVELVPHDRFQYVTEQAWDRLLRDGAFDQFRDCLDRCGARLGRKIDRTQLVFFVHILKFALWKADAEFLDHHFATLEDHYQELDRFSQGEFELLAELRDYVARRAEFIARGPCCARIDQAMRDWCTLSETAGDLSVLDCQHFINLRGSRLCDEFPEPHVDANCLLRAWGRIVDDVHERLEDAPEPDLQELSRYMGDLLIRHTRRVNRTSRNNLLDVLFVGIAAIVLTVLVAIISLWTRAAMQFYGWQWSGGLIDCLAGAILLGGAAVGGYWVFKIAPLAPRGLSYADVRRDFISLLRTAGVTPQVLSHLCQRYENLRYGDGDKKIRNTSAIADGLQADPAMAIFSLAQICLRAADVQPDDAPLIIL